MFRLLITVILVGGLGLGASIVWRDPGLRQALWQKGGAWLDDALGIHGPKKDKAPKPAPVVKQAPTVSAPKPLPVVTVAPAAPAPYVDRSATPTAVERVAPQDKQWLDDVIAQKAGKR